MRDRLPEIQNATGQVNQTEMEQSNTMEETIEDLRDQVNSLEGKLDQLKKQANQVLASVDVSNRDKRALESQISEFRTGIFTIQKAINEIDNELVEQFKSSDQQTKMTTYRNQLNHVGKLLLKLVESFNSMQVDYRSRIHDRVRRQIECLGIEVTEETLDKWLSEKGEDIFFGKINLFLPNSQAVLSDVQQRHDGILKIETDIFELQQMNEDLGTLVIVQGEKIDQIESNINGAGKNIEEGREKIQKAVEQKKWALRKKFWLMGILVILVVFAVVLLIRFL